MKTRLLLSFAGLVIGFAVPTLAQEQKTVSPEVRQAVEAVAAQLGEAINKHDAAAAAEVYALDAVKVLDFTTGGPLVGREAIEKDFAALFASSPSETAGKLIQLYTLGDQIAHMSEWSGGSAWGYSIKVFVRDADTWKIRLEYVTLTAAPRSAHD